MAVEQPEDRDGVTTGPGQRPRGEPGDGDTTRVRVDIGGDATGPIVAGHHNVVVDAQHGSAVTLLMDRERPRPVRRDHIALLPGRQSAPLGREAELAALADAVATGGPVLLWGPPGIGKSTLLRHAARSLPPGPDGVLFLAAAHREAGDLAQEIFEACYDTAGYAPHATELRRLMTGVRVTVYVDGAELSADALRELADAAPDATFVFACRERVPLGGGRSLELGGLDREAGVELLARELDPTSPEDARAAAELWKAAAGVPLLLLRAGVLARRDAAGTLLLPRPGATSELLPLLLDQLDARAEKVLRLLAALGDAELGVVHIGALTEVAEPYTVCARLADLGLITATDGGYRCAVDAGRTVRERHPDPFPVDRLCEYLAHWAAQPTTEPEQVAAHARAVEVAAELAERAGRPDLAVRVAWAASPALARALRFDAWGRLLDRGRGAAQQAGDDRAVAYFTHEQGIRRLVTGRRVLAGVLLAEAVVLWHQLGDGRGAEAAAGAQQYAPPPVSGPADGPGAAAPQGDAAPHADGGVTGQGGGPPGGDSAPPDSFTAPDSGPSPGNDPSFAGGPSHGGGPTADSAFAADPGDVGQPAAHAGDFTQSPGGPGPTAPDLSGTVAPTPPGVGESGGLTGGTASGTPAGASAATAAGGGMSAGTSVLAALAVITALVIGGVAVKNHQDSTTTANSSATPLPIRSHTPSAPTAPRTPTTFPTPPRAQEEPEPRPSPTGLAGTWRNSQGAVIVFTRSGPGNYKATARSICGNIIALNFTGSSRIYRGTEPLYEVDGGSCGRRLGNLNTTITLTTSGDTARVVKTPPSSMEGPCYGCGSSVLTRVR
ncbi:AAA family ATPase [Streptomyces smyrnaeus]|uniref:AAA family ATPase n=1 Tax=Streptomyces smyrnaeus TaxID=1387713 RepID=UPI00369891F5